MLTTLGLSPKAVLAFLFPAVSTLVATVSVWITSGTFNTAEVKVAVAGLLTSAVAALGAYIAQPGDVAQLTDPATIPSDTGDAGAPHA